MRNISGCFRGTLANENRVVYSTDVEDTQEVDECG